MALKPDSEKTRADQLAERQAREHEVFFREVDEAVRQDQLGGAAKKYGILVAIGLVLALAAFGGWLYWTEHQEGVKERRSERLITAFDQLDAGQMKQAEAELEALSGERGTAHAISADMARAGIALNQNRRADAIKLYEGIANDGGAPQPYRDLATIRSVAAQFDQLEPQKVVDRLKPLAVPGNPWFGSAGELVAMAYLKQGKTDLAGPLFAEIAKNEDVPQSLRSRTRQMAGLLGVDAVVDVDKTLAEVRQQEGGAPAAPPAQ